MFKKINKRSFFKDIIYNNYDIEKFINIIMVCGKKTISRNIVYKALNYVKNYFNKNPIDIFSKALNNVAPLIDVKVYKFSSKSKNNYVEIKKEKRKNLAMRWIKNYSKIRKEKFMYLKLGKEIIDSFNKKSESFKKKESVYKIFDSKRNYKRI